MARSMTATRAEPVSNRAAASARTKIDMESIAQRTGPMPACLRAGHARRMRCLVRSGPVKTFIQVPILMCAIAPSVRPACRYLVAINRHWYSRYQPPGAARAPPIVPSPGMSATMDSP